MQEQEERIDLKRVVDEHWPLAIVGALSGFLVVILVRHIDHGTMGFFAPDQSTGDAVTSFPVKILGVAGACLLILGLIQLALFVWWRRRIEQIPRRAIGFALLLLTVSGLLGLIGGQDAVWGGSFGDNLARGFERILPTPLALLVVSGLVAFALVLARDWFFYDVWRRWIGDSSSEAFALGMDVQAETPSAAAVADAATAASSAPASEPAGPRDLRRQAAERLGTTSVLDNDDIVQSDSFPDLDPIVANLDDIQAPRPLQITTTLDAGDLDMDADADRAHAAETTSFALPRSDVNDASTSTADDDANPDDDALSSFLADDTVDFDDLGEEVDFSVAVEPAATSPKTSEIITEEIPVVSISAPVETTSVATDEESVLTDAPNSSVEAVDLPEVLAFGLDVAEDEARVSTATDLSDATAALAITPLDDERDESVSSDDAATDLTDGTDEEELTFGTIDEDALDLDAPVLDNEEYEVLTADDEASEDEVLFEDAALDPEATEEDDEVPGLAFEIVEDDEESEVDEDPFAPEALDAFSEVEADEEADEDENDVFADAEEEEGDLEDEELEEEAEEVTYEFVEVDEEEDDEVDDDEEDVEYEYVEVDEDEDPDDEPEEVIEEDLRSAEDVAAAFEAARDVAASDSEESEGSAASWIEHQTDLAEMTGVMEDTRRGGPAAGEPFPESDALEEAPEEPQNQDASSPVAADEDDWGNWMDEPTSAPLPGSGPDRTDEPSALDDEAYAHAVRACLDRDRCSVSLLQRELGLGFADAAATIERMEAEGIVGPYRGTGDRELLVEIAEWEAR